MSQYIHVAENEGDEPMEVPSEDDGTLLLTTLSAQFPGACGLKYRNHDTGTLRGIRLSDGRLYPPDTDWGRHLYIAVFPKGKVSIDCETTFISFFSSEISLPSDQYCSAPCTAEVYCTSDHSLLDLDLDLDPNNQLSSTCNWHFSLLITIQIGKFVLLACRSQGMMLRRDLCAMCVSTPPPPLCDSPLLM